MIYSALLFFAGVSLSASRLTLTDNLENYTFERYLNDFNHKFSSSELTLRKNLFETEKARVIAHNKGKSSWKRGINKFSVMTESERKTSTFGRNKGVDRSHEPKNLKPLPSNFKLKDVSELPKSVDWRDVPNVVSAVKDQGHCGSCWAFASAAVLESHVSLASGLLFDLSPQQIAMCSPNPNSCGGTGGCNGATAELAFDYVAGTGILEEYQLGYTAYNGQNSDCGYSSASAAPVATIGGYVQLPENNYTALMNAIAQVGPIAVSVDASSWHSYAGGVFDGCNQESPDINHAVVLVGYGSENGQDYWLVRNSWAPKWGELGYIKVLRTNSEETRCGTDVTPQDGTACAGDNDPVKVCGTCGILYDSAYPIDVAIV
mmetsp:Transcript_18516/g.19286  ORF Transcript_18516/g.19286 Transcript_18516/m.19286 type:complete len:375 (+) Transcript_18516:46-1170(+)